MGSKFRDKLNYISKLSIKRIWNAIKVVLGFYGSRITGRVVPWGLPISIAIEPTTSCNLRCPECPSGLRQFSRPTGNLKLKQFEDFLSQVKGSVSYLTFYFQGEPFINPDFLKMVKLASKAKIYSATSTNAHFLSPELARKTVESGLDRLIISIDGTTQEVYEQYRKSGSLQKVLEGTRNMVEAKRALKSHTPHLIFQFLVVRPNQHQIDAVHDLAREMGVDEIRLKTAQVYDYKNGNPLIPTLDKYSRYKKLPDGTYAVKNSLENHCWRMWSSCVVTWDGNVVPCCFDKDADHTLGKLNETPFRELWFGEPYNRFRKQVLGGRSQVDICKNCSEGTKVWI